MLQYSVKHIVNKSKTKVSYDLKFDRRSGIRSDILDRSTGSSKSKQLCGHSLHCQPKNNNNGNCYFD